MTRKTKIMKSNAKSTEIIASGGITTREYSPRCILTGI